MKLIKMLGLAALAAITASAFVGVSAATADETNIVICAKAQLECETPVVTEVKEGKEVAQIHGTAKNLKLLSNLGTVVCEKSLANITVENELSESLLGHVTELSLEGCNFGEVECKVTTVSLGDAAFTKLKPLLANAKLDGKTKVQVVCGFFVNCTFGGTPDLAVHSSESGETVLLADQDELTTSGFACPTSAKLDAEYPANAAMWIES